MNRSDASLRSTFLSVEGVAYACFLLLDLTGHGDQTTPIKYAGIVLCLAFSLLGTDRLVPVALALTAGADWFLLVRNDRYLLGIALFLAVQAVYFLRLRRAGASPSPELAAFLRSKDTSDAAGGCPLDALLRRPHIHYDELAPFDPDRPELPPEVWPRLLLVVVFWRGALAGAFFASPLVSMAMVWAPTRPSADRLLVRWKSFTASTVIGP